MKLIQEKDKTKAKNDHIAGATDIAVAIKGHDEGMVRSTSACFPAVVRDYDRYKHKAIVVPLVKGSVFEGKWEYETGKTFEVTVRGVQNGGFSIDVPIYIGETGWVFASDRDTRLIKDDDAFTTSVLEKDRAEEVYTASYVKDPYQPKIHIIEDGFFIPDNWGQFQYERLKDSTKFNIEESMYIGDSISTRDDAEINQEELEKLDIKGAIGDLAKDLQSGKDYEKKTTASMVIDKTGGISLMSSSPEEEEQRARLTVEKNSIEMEAVDDKERVEVKTKIDTKDGIGIHQEYRDSTFDFSYKNGGIVIKTIHENGTVMINLNNGDITIDTKGDVTIDSGSHSMGINAKGGIDVTTETADISTNGATNIESGGNVSVIAKGDIGIKADGDLMLGAHGDLTVESGGDINITGNVGVTSEKSQTIESGGDVTIHGIESTHVGGSIGVQSMNLAILASGTQIKCENNDMKISSNKLKIDLKSSEDDSTAVELRGGNMSLGGLDSNKIIKGTASGEQVWTYPDDEAPEDLHINSVD